VITLLENQKQALTKQIERRRLAIAELEVKRHAFDQALSEIEDRRQNFRLLSNICSALDKLAESGSSSLFWGEDGNSLDQERILQRVRHSVGEFDAELTGIESARAAVQAGISRETAAIWSLNEELEEIDEEIEEAQNEYAVEREAIALPGRQLVMPWSHDGEDERRYRRIMLIILLLTLFLGWVVPLLKKPVDRSQPIVVPERIAQLIKKRQEPPPQAKPKKEDKPKEEKKEDKPKEAKPTPVETQQARAVAETKGILAFKNNFADLMEDSSPVKMGADARISDSGKTASGSASTRSMILSQAAGGSSGINTASLSRQGSGTGGGQNITGSGVKFSRVESATGNAVADERPLSKGVGPSRTDEEIQIVFDRYKSALYRIYNRELRNDPTLRGKMVLRLVIQPDGSVSACSVKSTDLASPALSAEIVARVLKFNFGPKEGVPAVTILYPIDFLPAN